MRKIFKRLALFIITGVLITGAVYNSDWFKYKYIYPWPYKEIIFHYALENELDPYLVAAVALSESHFNSEACSPKGAVGVMQIMPETGRWVAAKLNYKDFSQEDLKDSETNIRFGAWYLAALLKEFKGNEMLALAAYNGGSGNVKEWMDKYGWDFSFDDVDEIPFKETKDYVKRVRVAREEYYRLY